MRRGRALARIMMLSILLSGPKPLTKATDDMATSNAEAELIFNRANVSLARSQKLIASWLPQAADSARVTKSDEELQREEDEMFTPVPEK